MLNKLISLVILLLFLNINIVYSQTSFLLPQKKPSIFKKTENQILESINKNLPVPKPKLKIKENIEPKKIEKKETVETKKDEEIKKIVSFIYPKKKPITYKVSTKEIKSSKVLNQKDFDRAKETIKFIKQKKWNSALKSAEKV